MRRWSHVLLFCLYALAMPAVALLLPHRLPDLPPLSAWAAGGFVFLLGALLHLALALRATSGALRRYQETVCELSERLVTDQQRLSVTVERLDQSLAAIEDQAAPDVGNVVAEVRVLQSLVERLYSARAATETAAPQPTETPQTGKRPPLEKVGALHVRDGGAIKAESPASIPAQGARSAKTMGVKAPASRMPATGMDGSAAKAAAAAPAGDSNGSNSLPMPPIAEGLDEKTILDLVRDGLRENGVELALQPIVSLPQRKRRYFECSSPIRVGNDRVLIPDQYIDIAERHGLITAIDNLMLFRCIQMLRRLRRSNITTGFFLNISHHTLADRDFFHQFINLMAQHAELAPNLIFEFSQRGIESADQALWSDLARLAQMGFRFSIDQIYSLDIDVADLSSRHFRFLKLEADRLLEAVSTGQMGDDPGALKRVLDSYAIDLVVDRITDENMLRELLDLHIDFGQGYLFGEPRLVRNETASAAG
jgi:cyclic-di-GMP phosphodiesterase TipF (flagellum assembly factor)